LRGEPIDGDVALGGGVLGAAIIVGQQDRPIAGGAESWVAEVIVDAIVADYDFTVRVEGLRIAVFLKRHTDAHGVAAIAIGEEDVVSDI